LDIRDIVAGLKPLNKKDWKMSDWNRKVIEEFRANEGKVGGVYEDMDLLLLHTTGAKSGLERVNPVACMKDGDRLVIIASKGGADTHPDWYHNLLANPQVEVELGTERFRAKAHPAEEPERSKLYEKMAARYHFFAEYQRKTDRTIPVVVLTRDPTAQL
jgi:deazaflavin-dependent oxidoreductase (nitroreductase family)